MFLGSEVLETTSHLISAIVSDAVRMWFGCGSDVVRRWFGRGSEVVRMWAGGGSDVFSDLVQTVCQKLRESGSQHSKDSIFDTSGDFPLTGGSLAEKI